MDPSLSTIGLHRLYHQRISHSVFKTVTEVAARLGAMQGQDYAGTKWAFGVRLPSITDSAVEQAIVDGLIMRTWALRGTLQYVAPTNIHWLVGLIAPRQIVGNARRYKQLELDEPTLVRSTTLIAETLRDGQQRTRTELFAMLEDNHISPAGQRGVYMLQRAALERFVYQGPLRRNETTFRALGNGQTLPKEEALAELARRYFTSHGPATLADFIHWSGLLTSEARAGLESVKSELMEQQISGQTCFRSPETPEPPEHSLYLLPGFDEYALGYRDRSAVLDAEFADAICPGGNGMFMATIVSEGRIIGTWKRTLKKKGVDIMLAPFRALRPEEIAALDEAAARFGAFLGLTATIR